jgi:hypothetical protein
MDDELQTTIRTHKIKKRKAEIVFDTEVIPGTCVVRTLGKVKQAPDGKWMYKNCTFSTPEGAGIALLMDKIDDWDFATRCPRIL